MIHRLSLELDEQFHTTPDSVPTKVYSRLFWLRPGQSVLEEEIQARLQERDYGEIAEGEKLSPGMYRWDDYSPDEEESKLFPSADRWRRLLLFLKPFSYPPSIKKLFFDEENVGVDKGHVFSIIWVQGGISQVSRVGREEKEDISGLALEPVLVARLNSNDTETRENIPIKEIPYTLLQAIVSVEDRRFLEHGGIDPIGILRSIWVNIRAGAYRQGASTITQQLIRNIYLERSKTLKRKIKEMIMALLLELRYSKDTILEKYLNEVYFGQIGSLEVHGVGQAAKHYFNKKLTELSIAEQSVLTALIRGPFYYSPYRYPDRLKKRKEAVLEKILEYGLITEMDYEKALKEKLTFVEHSSVIDRYPYFTDFIKTQVLKEIPDEQLLGSGYEIFSTMDTYYQKIVDEKVLSGVKRLENSLLKKLVIQGEHDPLQAVFLLVDPKTNQLLAVVGGRSFKSSSYNRALLMRRQIGSLVKPFVFLTGLLFGEDEKKHPLNAISKIEDAPFVYDYDGKQWEPKNYSGKYLGVVTLEYALANSINTATARLATQTGIPRLVDTLRLAGMGENESLPSLSLGALEASPMEIAVAYSILANMGHYREITSVLAITDRNGNPVAQFIPREEQRLPQAETANIVKMMEGVFTEGTAKGARQMGFIYPAAGKTGTTNQYRDSWFAGFTSRLLGVAWVGYDRDNEQVAEQKKIQKITGASGALPIWVSIMKAAHKGIQPTPIAIPQGLLKKIPVDIITGGRATEGCEAPNTMEKYFTARNIPQYTCEDARK